MNNYTTSNGFKVFPISIRTFPTIVSLITFLVLLVLHYYSIISLSWFTCILLFTFKTKKLYVAEYSHRYNIAGKNYYIPKGFACDGSSNPFLGFFTKLLNNYLDFYGGFGHDVAYKVVCAKFGVTRFQADMFYLLQTRSTINSAFKYSRLSTVKVTLLILYPIIPFLGLRLFGWFALSKNREDFFKKNKVFAKIKTKYPQTGIISLGKMWRKTRTDK